MDMPISQSIVMFAALSALAGALHVLAPDHWVPASILTWQRGWRPGRTALFTGLIFLAHVLLGIVIYFAFEDLMSQVSGTNLLLFSLILIVAVAAVRGVRFSRIREVLRAGRSGVWGLLMVVSLLGPAECIIPILIKANQLGTGYLLPLVAFFSGTVIAGLILVISGQNLWNRPLLFPRNFQTVNRRFALVPVVATLAIGITLLIKL